jgi:hypothetical protein
MQAMRMADLASQLLIPTFFAFAMVCALAGTAIGVGLISAQGATLRFFAWVNEWIPTRARMKWAEVPHDTGRTVLAWRGWFAAAFILGGLFILLSAILRLGVERPPVLASRLGLEILQGVLVWMMVVGGLLTIVIGTMLVAAPKALARLESWTDRWVSTRQSGRGIAEAGDRMHLPLEGLALGYPRAVGGFVLALSLAGIVAAGSALVGQ